MPPAIVIHGASDLRHALAPGRPLVLVSAPGAALYAGAGWWRALVRLAEEIAPGLVAADWLDCADAAGRALEALHLGQPAIILDPRAPAFARVAAVADARGARLRPDRPPCLDLAAPGAPRRLSDWLGLG